LRRIWNSGAAHPSAAMPRFKRGIQYAAAYRLTH